MWVRVAGEQIADEVLFLGAYWGFHIVALAMALLLTLTYSI
jgi:hypothetical protein